ncbi:DNA primase [Lactobacillus crispatus]|uniref:DNA primase n=1 Tax=Lactobacillus crispatus TaxID=47770 RepID=UPI0022CDE354|nr:DNA primase [Lactobacillus crispatus]MCZ9662244.1 DNA primase [Lactobacillus crispatus]
MTQFFCLLVSQSCIAVSLSATIDEKKRGTAMAGWVSKKEIEKVKKSVNIVDVVSHYVQLTKEGNDYICLCPFHREKTPSFKVNPKGQFFKCFGCGRGGNVFKFLMLKNDIGFADSVKLAEQFMDATPVTNTVKTQEKPVEPNLLYKINHEASYFFYRVLLDTKTGERGRKYLADRKIGQDEINHFQLGYAPEDGNIFLTYLRKRNFTDSQIIKSGLYFIGSNGELVCRFRDRIMFPVLNSEGVFAGFAGRLVAKNSNEPKYLNSPTTDSFKKSELLYHLSETRYTQAQEKQIVLFEGFMDVISAYKAGIQSSVASMGTSLTQEQVGLLAKNSNSKQIVINYDGDSAGRDATERALALFERYGGFNVKVVVLPDSLDPDEYIKRFGSKKYVQCVKSAIKPSEFLINHWEKKFDLKTETGKKEYIDYVLNYLSGLNDPHRKSRMLQTVAKRIGVDEYELQVEFSYRNKHNAPQNKKSKGYTAYDRFTDAQNSSIPKIQRKSNKSDDVQQYLLMLYLHSKAARKIIDEKDFSFPNSDYQDVRQKYKLFKDANPNAKISKFFNALDDHFQWIIVNLESNKKPLEFTLIEITSLIDSLSTK